MTRITPDLDKFEGLEPFASRDFGSGTINCASLPENTPQDTDVTKGPILPVALFSVKVILSH